MPEYFLYRHIRLDKNEPFYIGVGRKQENCFPSIKSIYARAFRKSRKNAIWRSITARTKYDVEVLYESESREEILNKEKEFIKLYGRIIDKTGILSNIELGGLTDFGENGKPKYDWVGESKKNGTFEDRMRKVYIQSPTYNGVPTHVKSVYVYDLRGAKIESFTSKRNCAKKYGAEVPIGNAIKERSSYKGFYFSYIDYGGAIDLNDFKVAGKERKPVKKVNINTGEIVVFNSIEKLAESINSASTHVRRRIDSGCPIKGFYLIQDESKHNEKVSKRTFINYKKRKGALIWKRGKICRVVEIYPSHMILEGGKIGKKYDRHNYRLVDIKDIVLLKIGEKAEVVGFYEDGTIDFQCSDGIKNMPYTEIQSKILAKES